MLREVIGDAAMLEQTAEELADVVICLEELDSLIDESFADGFYNQKKDRMEERVKDMERTNGKGEI